MGRRSTRAVLAAGLAVLLGFAALAAGQPAWAGERRGPAAGALRTPAPDPAVLQWAAHAAPQARVLNAIAADIDRDGDLDLIVTTTHELVAVWMNQGLGQFTRQAPAPRSRLAGSSLDGRRDETTAASIWDRERDRLYLPARASGHAVRLATCAIAPAAEASFDRAVVSSSGRAPPRTSSLT